MPKHLISNDKTELSNLIKSVSDKVKVIEENGVGGASDFTKLKDAPTSYFGQANKLLKVNASQTGLEFTTPRFTDLVDVPTSLSTNIGKTLKVNASGNALEFVDPETGMADLSAFTTADLQESTDKKYITDSEKTKLTQLDGIIADQTTITNNINAVNTKIPSSASSTNKLTVKSDINTAINSLKFTTLPDTPSTLTPNSLLAVNAAGTAIEQIDAIDGSIRRVTDSNKDEYTGIKEFLFNKLKGNLVDTDILELTPELRSTDILDLPATLTHGGLLVANADTGKYEHRLIEDLTFSKENFTAEINDVNWVLNTTTNKYEYTLVHTLDSLNVIAAFYDIESVSKNLSFKVINATSIKVFSDYNIYTKVVLNSALGASSPDYGKLPPVYTFLDDSMSRTDKTYSSSKIESRLLDFAKKSNVYTKMESDSKFAVKTNEHNHLNMVVLNDFTSNVDGELLWRNKKILNKVEPFFHQVDWVGEKRENLDMILSVYDIYTSMGYTTIVNSEILIKNNKPIAGDAAIDALNELTLIIMDDGIEVVNTKIPPQERQKFILGMSPNVKIYIKGEFDGKYYVGAF